MKADKRTSQDAGESHKFGASLGISTTVLAALASLSWMAVSMGQRGCQWNLSAATPCSPSWQPAIFGGLVKLCCAAVQVSSGLILLNKDLLSHGFPYPMALSGLGMAFSGAASFLCCKVRCGGAWRGGGSWAAGRFLLRGGRFGSTHRESSFAGHAQTACNLALT